MNKNLIKFNKILALAPHTYDVELGCGGLLFRYKVREFSWVRNISMI